MKELENKKRIVIKVGSSTLAYHTGHLNIRKCQHLIEVMSDIKNSGREVIFVTSGAQGVGAAQADCRASRQTCRESRRARQSVSRN